MRKTIQPILYLFIILLGLSASVAQAQEKQTAYPGPSSSFYIGAKGGYLFKNSSLADDPAFFLDQGYFGELNLGWRSSSFWGWQLNLGRLNINRDLPSYKDRKSTRLNSSHVSISYAVFCLKKKTYRCSQA